MTSAPKPYNSTPVFDETTLSAGLRREHRTKAGVWGVIQVLEGRLRYEVLDPASEAILDPDQPHFVEPLWAMQMQVDFYDRHPGEQPA